MWPGLTTPLAANICSTVRFCCFCLFWTLRNFMYWISEVMTPILSSFFASPWTLALSTAGDESINLRLHIPSKHELIFTASAEWTGFVIQLSRIESSFAKCVIVLFVHCVYPETRYRSLTVECDNGTRKNFLKYHRGRWD